MNCVRTKITDDQLVGLDYRRGKISRLSNGAEPVRDGTLRVHRAVRRLRLSRPDALSLYGWPRRRSSSRPDTMDAKKSFAPSMEKADARQLSREGPISGCARASGFWTRPAPRAGCGSIDRSLRECRRWRRTGSAAQSRSRLREQCRGDEETFQGFHPGQRRRAVPPFRRPGFLCEGECSSPAVIKDMIIVRGRESISEGPSS